jgi:hypothetical protein
MVKTYSLNLNELLLVREQPFNLKGGYGFQWDDDEIRFVLDQHAELYSASTLKQQSADKRSLHSNTLFWFRANKSLIFLLNAACLAEKQHISIL